MQFIASSWPACLPSFCLHVRLLLNSVLFLYSAGRDARSLPEMNIYCLKNVAAIAQTCSETQISFARAQPFRQKRGVDRPRL